MSRFIKLIGIAAMMAVTSNLPVFAQQSSPVAPPPAEPMPPVASTPPVDEAAMLTELKRLYAFPVLANECGYELSDAEFVRLDSAVGLAEQSSGFAEEKLDEIFNDVEGTLKEDLFKKGQEAACKEREAGFKAFVTGLPD